ncbi:hypothetical protein CVT26_004044 [Gymnopilus dilepis]|uniref:Uncharacterized protein n=1 Tax=Gymnopilus dilepis TaxID=231916 RepID=A0A409WTS3_9AGAR|nr:hypothetical protein CVT26_004044 [Gymnopilus dilepis]
MRSSKRPSTYGLNSRRELFTQLLELLSIQPSSSAADELRDTLRELAREYLDLNLCPGEQASAFLKLKKELPNHFPDLFFKSPSSSSPLSKHPSKRRLPEKEEKKLTYFLLRTIARFHHHARSNWIRTVRDRKERMLQKGGRFFMKDIVEYEEDIDVGDATQEEDEGEEEDENENEEESEVEFLTDQEIDVDEKPSFQKIPLPTRMPRNKLPASSQSERQPQIQLALDDFPRLIQDTPSPAPSMGMTLRSNNRRSSVLLDISNTPSSGRELRSPISLSRRRSVRVLGDGAARDNSVCRNFKVEDDDDDGNVGDTLLQTPYKTPLRQASVISISSSDSPNVTKDPSSFNLGLEPEPTISTGPEPWPEVKLGYTPDEIQVHTFLSTCSPPFTHLLPNFLAYGCTSEVYLRALATFPGARRREALRRIFRTHVEDGNAHGKMDVKEIDLDLLEEHLEGVQRIFFVLHVVARIHNDRRRGRQYTKAKGIASQKPQTPRRLETIARQIELAERMEVIEQVDSDLEGPDSETGDVSQILVANGAKNCTSTGANWQSVPKAIPTKPQVPRSLSPGATVKPSTSRKSITSYFKLTEPSSKNKSYSQEYVSTIPALPTSNKRTYTYEEQPLGNTPPNTLPSRLLSTPQLPVNLDTCNEIRTFLSRCRPPLTHLLPNFLAYGCTSEEYLRAVAAFPETKRREVLRGILGLQVNHGDLNSAGRKVIVKEFDLDLLEDHFDKCFEE